MKLPSPREYIPATAAGRSFAVTSMINAIGTGLYLAGPAVFFVRSVGLTAAQVGLGLAVSGVVGFLTTVPIGALADRFGAKPTLVVLQLWRAGGFVALAFAEGMVSFTVVSCCLAAAEAATQPMTQAVASATTEGTDRTRTMAIVRTVGFSLGALLAAPLLAADRVWTYRGIVLGTAAAFVLSAAMLSRVRTVTAATVQKKVNRLAVLLAACVLLTFGEMWQAVGSWELSYDFAPEDRKGVCLSVFSLGNTGRRIVGPALITGGVLAAGPAGWIALGAVFGVAGLLVTPVTRMLCGVVPAFVEKEVAS